MALLWQKEILGNRYQVRSAGRTRRIYKNGILHSQYNPTKLFTGSVWDLLSLPALLYPKDKIQRILLLGVGGGTVIHQLHHLCHYQKLSGVDLDKTHLMLARKFFLIEKSHRVSLHHADAEVWLNEKDQRYDMIIDDVFKEENGEPVRAIESNSAWMNLLFSRLDDDGVLVQNYADSRELRSSAAITDNEVKSSLKTRFRLTTRHYENNIAVFSRQQLSAGDLRQRLNQLKCHNIQVNRSTVSMKIRQIID
jgi:spermidine synthase